MPIIRRDIGQEVQPDGELQVARIEVNEVIRTRRRDVFQQFLGEIAVRIDQTNAVSGGDVLHQQVAEQGRLAGTGLADQVEVLAGVGSRKPEGHWLPPVVELSDVDKRVVHGAQTSRHS